MKRLFEILKTLSFEAAHTFPHKGPGHENTHMHGHSFTVDDAQRGIADPASGCIVDFENLGNVVTSVRTKLGHHFLNDLPGLGTPSQENLSRWIATEMHGALPQAASVTVRRPTLGESCRFESA